MWRTERPRCGGSGLADLVDRWGNPHLPDLYLRYGVEHAVSAMRSALRCRDERAVYVLHDPGSHLPRYVGLSVNPEKRLDEHVSAARRGGGWPLHAWLRELDARGREPVVRVVVPTGATYADETSLIRALSRAGFALLNVNGVHRELLALSA